MKKRSALVLACGLAAMLLGSIAQAKDVAHSYAQLEAALKAGHQVTALLDLGLCHDGSGAPGPATQGGFPIGEYMIMGGAQPNIGFAMSHLTVGPSNAITNEFVRYRVTTDNKVNVEAFDFTPGATVAQQRGTWVCDMDHGMRFAW